MAEQGLNISPVNKKTDPLDQISSRIKYYLLDYKDKNMEAYQSAYGTKRLRDLTLKELKHLFKHASDNDHKKMLG